MADKRRTNKKATKKKRCIAQGAIKSQTAQRSPAQVEWDGNRTGFSLAHSLITRTKFEAASNPRQHFICSLVISLPFATSSLQFFPHFHCHSTRCCCRCCYCCLLLGLVNEPKRVFVSGIERDKQGGRVRCASSAARLEFVCQYVGPTQSLCWWLCCFPRQRRAEDRGCCCLRAGVGGKCAGVIVCSLGAFANVRVGGLTPRILQGLRIFPLLLLLCVAYAASSLSVHVCVSGSGSIKTTIIVSHIHKHTLC